MNMDIDTGKIMAVASALDCELKRAIVKKGGER